MRSGPAFSAICVNIVSSLQKSCTACHTCARLAVGPGLQLVGADDRLAAAGLVVLDALLEPGALPLLLVGQPVGAEHPVVGVGLPPRARLVLPAALPRSAIAIGEQQHVGHRGLDLLDELLRRHVWPARQMALTPSPFHFSMKLSSCDWAVDVSEPRMVRTAAEPWATPMRSRAGLITVVTDAAVSVSVRVATFLPVRVPWALSRLNSTVARRSAVMSVLSISAGRCLADPLLVSSEADVDRLVVAATGTGRRRRWCRRAVRARRTPCRPR